MKEKVIKNTLISGTATFLIGIIGFLLLPFMVSKVGAVGYGLFAMVNIFAFSGYLSLLEMGFQSSIARFVAEYKTKEDYRKISEILTSTFVMFFIIGFILMVLGFSLSTFIVNKVLNVPANETENVLFAIKFVFLSYLFQFPTVVLAGFFEGAQRFDILKKVQVFAYFFYAISAVAFLLMGKGFIAILLSQIASQLLIFILYAYLLKKSSPFVRFGKGYFSIASIKEVWEVAKLLFIGKWGSVVFYQTPPVLLSVILGPASLTAYEVVMRLPRFLKVVLGFANAAIMPAAAQLQTEKNMDKMKRMFVGGLSFQSYFILPIIFCAMYFAEDFLSVWMGPEFAHLSTLLQVALIWNIYTPFIGLVGAFLLGMNRKLKKITSYSIATAGLNLAISLLFIWTFEVGGVVVGFVGSGLIMVPLYLSAVFSEIPADKKDLLNKFLKAGGCAILPGLVFMFLPYADGVPALFVLAIKGVIWQLISFFILYSILMEEKEKHNVKAILNSVNLARVK